MLLFLFLQCKICQLGSVDRLPLCRRSGSFNCLRCMRASVRVDMCVCMCVCACMFLGKDRQQQVWANEPGLPDHDPKPRDSGGRRLGSGSTLSTLNHSHGFQIHIYDEMEAKMRLQVKSRPLYHP